jgi:hypothetical protein
MAVSKKTQALIDQAVNEAVAATKVGLVAAESKPDQIEALRKTWRATAEHKRAQVVRFFSTMAGVLAIQVGGDLMAHKDPFAALHTGRDLLYFLGPVAYVAWRQMHPALTAAQVDAAPGVTIVPSQVGAQTVDVAVDNAQVEVTLPDETPDAVVADVAADVEGDAAP